MALVSPEEYKLLDLESAEYQEFKKWTADMSNKYPQLYRSYSLLYECWMHYHSKGE